MYPKTDRYGKHIQKYTFKLYSQLKIGKYLSVKVGKKISINT